MTAATLPPGPGPAPLNLLGWVMRPIPFAQLEMRIALRAILSEVQVASALVGREGVGRRSIMLSPRRGTPISVRPRVREPRVALSA